MDSELGAWLRQQREDRGWPKPRWPAASSRPAAQPAATAIPALDGMLHNIHRWEREGGVSERHKLHYCRALGIQPGQFGPRPADTRSPGLTAGQRLPAVARPGRRRRPGARAVPPASLARPGPHLPASAAVAYRERQEPGLGDFAVEREVMMAAHEGSDHAAEHEQHGIGEATLEQLRADLARLSGLSDTGAPLSAFLDMRRVRDRIYRLLDRRLWPR